MGGDRKNEPWHWAGSTSDKKNPLSLTSQQKAGIKKAYPEQSKNKFIKIRIYMNIIMDSTRKIWDFMGRKL